MAKYDVDVTHSEISFTVRHMMFAKVRGQFTKWNATFAYDPVDPTRSSVEVEIDASSIDTREPQRDGHLRSADFFDAAKFPKLAFKSKRVEPSGAGRYKLTGDLTIRDVTREVTLDVEQTGGGKDPWGNERVGFSLKGSIQRSDWGLKWNQALEAGGVLVSDKVEIEAEVQAIQPKAAAKAPQSEAQAH
jgi:polyisoprenoid-binding protein YceI